MVPMKKHVEVERVILTNIEGFARLTGMDQYGNQWRQFEVDYFADQKPGICSFCGSELESGWQCLDGGDEVCDDHIEFEENLNN